MIKWDRMSFSSHPSYLSSILLFYFGGSNAECPFLPLMHTGGQSRLYFHFPSASYRGEEAKMYSEFHDILIDCAMCR